MKDKICPFCDINQSYRYIVESENMRVIYPKSPACRFHLLIVPKRHAEQIDNLNDTESAEMHNLIKLLVARFKENIPEFIGYNILSNNGSTQVNQHVKHCHLHVFLRLSYEQNNPLIPDHATTPKPLTKSQLADIETLKNLTII